MRNLRTFLLITAIFVSSISAQNSVVPIVYSDTLIGGTENGKWISAEKTDAQLTGKTEFIIISLKRIKKPAIVGIKGDRGICKNPRIIIEEDFTAYNPDEYPNFALGANAKWNPVPRIPQAISLTDKTYTKLVGNLLKAKGLADTKIEITQAFRIDLEGDGKDEIIIVGNHSKLGSSERQNVGDYSFLLLRKLVKGKLQNILIEGEFFTSKLINSGQFDPPSYRKIVALTDLNGDGKMEIVLSVIYQEGNREVVLEMKNGKPVKVLESGCSV